jgi:hypothetical protein
VLDWFLLRRGIVYQLIAAGEVLFAVLVAAAAWGSTPVRNRLVVRNCYYFFLLNAASAVAFVRFLKGDTQVLWAPRAG